MWFHTSIYLCIYKGHKKCVVPSGHVHRSLAGPRPQNLDAGVHICFRNFAAKLLEAAAVNKID